MKLSPEQAMATMVAVLSAWTNNTNVVGTGSVALGTYTGDKPDLDVFVVTLFEIEPVFEKVKAIFPKGYEKKGDLLIWHLDDYEGYPADIVVVQAGNEKTHTLKHIDFYRRALSDADKEAIKELKIIFKRLNLYGAEVGGITGICITELVRQHHTVLDVLDVVRRGVQSTDEFKVMDPTTTDRDIFASVMKFKRELMAERLWTEIGLLRNKEKYHIDMANRFRVNIMITKLRDKGTDVQFQAIHSTLISEFNALKTLIKYWNPTISYDIMDIGIQFIVGYSLHPEEILDTYYEEIHVSHLSDADFRKLIVKGGEYNLRTDTIIYPRKSPVDCPKVEFGDKLAIKLRERGFQAKTFYMTSMPL